MYGRNLEAFNAPEIYQGYRRVVATVLPTILSPSCSTWLPAWSCICIPSFTASHLYCLGSDGQIGPGAVVPAALLLQPRLPHISKPGAWPGPIASRPMSTCKLHLCRQLECLCSLPPAQRSHSASHLAATESEGLAAGSASAAGLRHHHRGRGSGPQPGSCPWSGHCGWPTPEIGVLRQHPQACSYFTQPCAEAGLNKNLSQLPSPPTFAEANLLLEQQQNPFRQVLGMLAGSHPALDLGGSGCKPPGLYEVSETHLSDHQREALAPHAVMAMPCTS